MELDWLRINLALALALLFFFFSVPATAGLCVLHSPAAAATNHFPLCTHAAPV